MLIFAWCAHKLPNCSPPFFSSASNPYNISARNAPHLHFLMPACIAYRMSPFSVGFSICHSIYDQGSQNLSPPLVVGIDTSDFTITDKHTSHHLQLRQFLCFSFPCLPLYHSSCNVSQPSVLFCHWLPSQAFNAHTLPSKLLQCCLLKSFWSTIQLSLLSLLPALPSFHEPAYHHPFSTQWNPA